jgi:hybrid polyketide synthase/nonribosomal peptide synthetase ACE1
VILEDTPFRDMSLEALHKVTRPKVDGSVHLNDLFQHHDLDFFIFFSSVGSVNGNLGQSNYAAANLFMTALAENRRRRGLAASVMHIGPIHGVGYITQQGIKSQSIERISMPISELDFLHHFAEAVVTGRPNSHSALEITAGLQRIDTSTLNQDVSPFMSHYIRDREVAADDSSADKSKAPIKTQLAEARGQAQVSRIIRDAFLPKLSALFHSDLRELQNADLTALRLDEMGIDSLMAVDIRGWFVKTLEVNIPVLKILSGVPVAELITIAVENISASLVPHIDEEALDPAPHEQRLPSVQTKSDLVSPQQPQTNQDARLQTGPQQQRKEVLVKDGIKTSTSSSSKGDVTPESDLELVDAADIQTMESSFTSVTPITDQQGGKDAVLEGSFTLVAPAADPRVENGDTLVLEKSMRISHSQGLFWFATAFSEDPTSLNISATFRLTGKLRVPDLQKAVSALGQQHESLRTCILEKDDQVMQGIMKSTPLSLEVHQIQDESEVARHFDDVHSHLYDLRRGYMVRLVLLSLSPSEHYFVVGVHHMAMDATSFQFLMRDLLHHYTHIGRPNPNPNLLTPQYSEFSEKQHIEFAAGKFDDELSFWRRELSPMPPELPILRISTTASRPSLQVFGNEHAIVRFDAKTKTLIQALCRRCRATPFHFYLAVLRVLLWRYSGAEDFAIGVADANRTEDGMMGALGNFVNLLPLVFHTQGSARFDTLLQETRSKTHSALGNSRLPFQLLLNEYVGSFFCLFLRLSMGGEKEKKN